MKITYTNDRQFIDDVATELFEKIVREAENDTPTYPNVFCEAQKAYNDHFGKGLSYYEFWEMQGKKSTDFQALFTEAREIALTRYEAMQN